LAALGEEVYEEVDEDVDVTTGGGVDVNLFTR
jgi:hypothetical protein